MHRPAKDSPCDCHYKGTLIDGEELDSSYSEQSKQQSTNELTTIDIHNT